MISRKSKPDDPLCQRCLKLQKIECAVVAFGFELSFGAVSLCQRCADIVEHDGGEIKGCNLNGYPLELYCIIGIVHEEACSSSAYVAAALRSRFLWPPCAAGSL